MSFWVHLHFPEHKLVIEVDEKSLSDRYNNHETGRPKAIEEKLGCMFIRINPYN